MLINHRYSTSLRIVLALALLTAFLGVTPVQAAGVTWYVATTGDDSNSCSSAGSPCAAINGAIGKSSAGDIIKVATGTYTGTGNEVVYISKDITLSGGWNASFTTQSGLSTIDGQGTRRGITSTSDFVPTTVVIDHFMITNGFVDFHGGGLNHNNGTLTLSNSIVSSNFSLSRGGGIFNFGTMIINNSTISNNQMGQICCGGAGGGAGIENNGSLTLNNSTVSGNIIVYGYSGSGIYSWDNLTLNNSTIYGNSGSNGEGIVAGGTTVINNSTISGNQSYGLLSAGALTLRNTIIAGNGTDNLHGDCLTYEGETLTSQGHNLIGDISECHFVPAAGDLTGVDPGLGQLVGSPGYLSLLPGSPAINAGNPATCLANDQRGLARPQGAACDIGAYEYAVPGVAASVGIADGSGQRSAVGIAFAEPLSVYVLDSNGSPVPGVTITFTAPASGASGTFTGSGTRITNVVSNSSGVATSSLFTANNVSGSYQVTATVSGVAAPASFSLTNVTPWYVATTGNDANSCATTGSPCRSINGALSKAAASGDTIKVANGTYTASSGEEVVLIEKGILLSGGWNNTFTAQTGWSVIDGGEERRGITAWGAKVILDGFVILNGFHSHEGGGVANLSTINSTAIMIINDTYIIGNLSGHDGGGIYNVGKLTLNNTTVSENISGDPCCYSTGPLGGGGGIFSNGTLTLNNSLVSANFILGGYPGSGISSDAGTVILKNSTVSGNQGGLGQGVFTSTGTIFLNNSTITRHPSYGVFQSYGLIKSRNTIIAGNGSNGDCYSGTGTFISQGYNLIGKKPAACTFSATTGDLVGTSVNPLNPQLGPLQDNGGSTYTIALDSASPAIDAGDDTHCLSTDQRGMSRPQGAACDIGAFEAEYTLVDVTIGNSNLDSHRLVAHGSRRQSFAGVNNGPVKIEHLENAPLIAAERLIYRVNGVPASFTEMMGLPASQLDNTYWLPWYNNVDLDTQLRIGNVSNSTATVQIFIGGNEVSPVGGISLDAGGSTRVSYVGVNNGPVKIVSNQDIVAAERLIYKVGGKNTSFSEMMALPNGQLNTTYWLPWYNNVDLNTQLRFANVSNATATVHVYIGGVEMQNSPFTLAVGESTRQSFVGVNNGPVKIVSNQDIVAAERLIYKVNGVNTSFSEMMALPNSALNATYWLPWYNNVDLDTQLRFANVSNATATVHVYIGGSEMNGSPFTLLPGESTRQSFLGVNNGPVQIVSNQNIVAAERLIYKAQGVKTSFSEMMALPNSQLDTTYWLPWYNNVDLDTQLRFGVP